MNELKKLIESLGKDIIVLRENHAKEIKALQDNKGVADNKELELKVNTALENQEKKLEELKAVLQRNTIETGEFTAAQEKKKEIEEKRCSEKFFRAGDEKMTQEEKQVLIDAQPREIKELITTDGPSGGYFVRPALFAGILKTIRESSPMRSLAKVQPITTDTLEILVDKGKFKTYWQGETATALEDTPESKIGMLLLATHQIFSNPEATNKMLQDSAIDIESWINEKLSEAFGLDAEDAFFNGSGVGMPKGIITDIAKITTVNSGTDAKVTDTGTVKVQGELVSETLQANATWLCQRKTATALRLLKDSDGQFQFSYTGDLTSPRHFALLGRPLQYAHHMPELKTGNVPLLYGDFNKAYMILDRTGMSVLRNPFKKAGRVIYQASMRIGGALVDSQAIVGMKTSA